MAQFRSCKGRGVCPSCNTRRMAEVAAHLTDRVLPWLPVRQWVLSVPKRLRPYLHSDPKVASGILRVFLRGIRSTLHATSPGAPASVAECQIGAVSFLHRFGSSLNAHFHYHVIVLDGVFSESQDEGPEFHEASELGTRHWQELQRTVQKRVLRYFRRHDLLDASTTADMLTWQGTGGFSIDASVRIEGHDRHGLERLVRYCARPPFALHRLHAMGGNEALRSPDAQLVYRLSGPTPDGRTVLILSPMELLQRLARLVPPPRVHRHRYHGVLAPNARLRAEVIARRPSEVVDPPLPEDEELQPSDARSSQAPGGTPSFGRSARIRWAQLLARIYEVLPLLCPSCGGEMRILAFLTDPPVVRSILVHLDLPHRPPPVAPARGPPQGDFLLDQSLGVDPTEAEPAPAFDFDQSGPEFEFDQSLPGPFDG
ncbi:MAG: transposase [Gemmatimonadota bacterium]